MEIQSRPKLETHLHNSRKPSKSVLNLFGVYGPQKLQQKIQIQKLKLHQHYQSNKISVMQKTTLFVKNFPDS